jgi:putative Ca2+/H+ antiporter (TMEM165/GDT1 family)
MESMVDLRGLSLRGAARHSGRLRAGIAMRELAVMFLTIFVAELGDKTQLATLLFASERRVPAVFVFAASAGALIVGAALAVLVGTTAGRYLQSVHLKPIAGVGFIAIGVWTLVQYFYAR